MPHFHKWTEIRANGALLISLFNAFSSLIFYNINCIKWKKQYESPEIYHVYVSELHVYAMMQQKKKPLQCCRVA